MKRKLSICQRPTFSLDDDGYCYDEDGQISEMLSSFINNSIDEPRSDLLGGKKPRSRKSSIDTRPLKENESKKRKVLSVTQKKHAKTDDKGKLKKSQTKEKDSKKESVTEKTSDSLLPPTEATVTNKTEKKNALPGTSDVSLTRKSSVKEVIPAKRTRFLSIDGSLMRYGATSKKSYSHMKSLKQNSESPELRREKVSTHKPLKTTTGNLVSSKKSVQKSKVVKEKNETVSEAKKPNDLKKLKAAQKTTSQKSQSAVGKEKEKDKEKDKEKEKEKIKVPLKQAIKENRELKEMLVPKSAAKESPSAKKNESVEKSSAKAKIIENVILKTATEFSDAWKKANKIPSKSKETNVEQNQPSPKTSPIDENTLDKPLSERSLCSTMVSPLKIIIEPKRDLAQMTLKERILAKDPLAIGQFNDSNSFSVESPSSENIAEKKEVHRTPQISERPTEKPMPKPFNKMMSRSLSVPIDVEAKKSNTNKKVDEKLPTKSNADPLSIRNGAKPVEAKPKDNKMTGEKLPTKANAHIEIVDANVSEVSKPVTIMPSMLFPTTDPNASIKPYLDIEMLLPSTRIPQPKPARRCMQRAQTISHEETPFRSFEPMQLRSSNFSWNQKQFGPSKEPTNTQYRSNLSFKSMERNEFTIPKRKPAQITASPPKVISSPKASNANSGSNNTPATLQRTPIDVSSFPDPESLEIPSIDLRSSALANSSLSMPLPIPMPMSVPVPVPVPAPLPVPKPAPLITMPTFKPSIAITETVKGNKFILAFILLFITFFFVLFGFVL